jgi:hypothetical protein
MRSRPPALRPPEAFYRTGSLQGQRDQLHEPPRETKFFANAARNQEELAMRHIGERIQDREQELGKIPRMVGGGELTGSWRLAE